MIEAVVERVGDDRVVLVEEGLEDRAVGVEAGGEQDRIVVPDPLGDVVFESAVQVERSADESHRGHAESVLLHGGSCCSDHVRVIGETEVVVRAEVEHLRARAALVDGDLAALG